MGAVFLFLTGGNSVASINSATEMWAKSKVAGLSQKDKQVRTLTGHSKSVHDAFNLIFGSAEKPTRHAEKWLQFFGLDGSTVKCFFANCTAACLLHDMGKANSGFQEAVQGKRDAQLIRHEHLSGLLISLPAIQEWLITLDYLDYNVTVSAVIGHHFKAETESCFTPLNADRKNFAVYPRAVNDLISMLAVQFGQKVPEVDFQEHWSFGDRSPEGLETLRENLRLSLRLWSRRLEPGSFQARLLMAVRAALVVADSAGSSYVAGVNIGSQGWLGQVFADSQQLQGLYVTESIIRPRVEQLSVANQWHGWHDFQEAASNLPDRTLLLAPCGSGKTLAAWRWIEAQLKYRSASRVIFLYPTRATATEGFKDYVAWAPESDGALLHGTAAYELEGMFENPEDSRAVKDFSTEDKLFALAYWQRKVFSATVDQFLGFMQNSYRSICLLPLLSDSILVIDEVHSFDRSLFSALKKFLKTFDLPVMCMTASLPSNRVQDLEECGLTVFPRDSDRFSDLDSIARMPRYRIEAADSREKCMVIARDGLAKGKKVLWVVNTVARCQALALELEALCYHSRFKLEDRKTQHKKVIEAFRRKDDPVIVVTTQVCEMSLDLDAGILITETAPVPALIQRMGRCNRHARPQSGKLGSVYIYQPENNLPYSSEELQGSSEFLVAVQGDGVSQYRLQELLDIHGTGETELEKYASFIDCGPWAGSREETLREDSGNNVSVIIDSDIKRYLELKELKKPTDGLYLQVPEKNAAYDDRVGSRPLVAPSSRYSCDLGFQ